MTIPTPATQMARVSFHCPRDAVQLHEHHRRAGRAPCRRREVARLPDVLRKMMSNIQNKGAY